MTCVVWQEVVVRGEGKRVGVEGEEEAEGNNGHKIISIMYSACRVYVILSCNCLYCRHSSRSAN